MYDYVYEHVTGVMNSPLSIVQDRLEGVSIDAYKGEAYHAAQLLVSIIRKQHYFTRYKTVHILLISTFCLLLISLCSALSFWEKLFV